MLVKETQHDLLKVSEYDDWGTYRSLSDRDNHTSVRFWSHTNEDGEIGVVGFERSTPHSCVYHQKNHGSVVIYPSHPRYAEYPFPEVEVEPSPSEDEVVLGKIIASWDIAEVFSHNPL